MTDDIPTDPTPPPTGSSPFKRRPRYRGKNPRRFDEKYKEHAPEKYKDDIRKILESGKTPAGTHRPICVAEILAILAPKPGETVVDCTFGYGGHSSEILPKILPGGRLIALDVDPIELPRTEARLREKGFGPDALIVRRSNFAGFTAVLAAEGIGGADCLLADLGVSSMQIDNPARGFTFKEEGPLDLRMNPLRGRSAAEFILAAQEDEIAAILSEYADEPDAAPIARTIKSSSRAIRTTGDLVRAVRDALCGLPGRRAETAVENAARRVFQALRIAVNDEFGALDALLRNLPAGLNPGGRAAILTFHSGEDRRVKHAFQEGLRSGVYNSVSHEVIRPTPEETRSNPRAASAKLRWAVKA